MIGTSLLKLLQRLSTVLTMKLKPFCLLSRHLILSRLFSFVSESYSELEVQSFWTSCSSSSTFPFHGPLNICTCCSLSERLPPTTPVPMPSSSQPSYASSGVMPQGGAPFWARYPHGSPSWFLPITSPCPLPDCKMLWSKDCDRCFCSVNAWQTKVHKTFVRLTMSTKWPMPWMMLTWPWITQWLSLFMSP